MAPSELILPPPVVARLRELLDAVPGAELRAHREELPGGFTKPEAIRAHLAGVLDRPGRWPEWLAGLLEPHLPCGRLVLTTSDAALAILGLYLPAALGDVEWAVALLLDGRPEARSLIHDLLARPDFGREPTEEGRTLYAEYVLGSFLTEVLPDWKPPALPGAAEPPTAADPAPIPEDLLAEIGNLREENARLRSAVDHPNEHQRRRLRDQEERLRAKFAAARRPLDEAMARQSAEVAELTSACDTARREFAAAQAEAKRLAAELEQARASVGEQVERRLAAEQFAWLRELRATEAAAREAAFTADELLMRAASVLARQAEQDRHAGNRRQLRGTLAALEAAAGRLEEAQADALQPLPALADTLLALRAETERVRARLGNAPANGSPAVHALRAHMARAPSAPVLNRTAELLRELRELLLLNEEEERMLRRELDRRQTAFARHGELRESMRSRLRRKLHAGEAVHLLLDGYNVIRLMPGLVPAGADGRAARERLNRAVEQLAGRHAGMTATVVYDSPEARRQEVAPRFVIEFSGGGLGPDRADRRIRELLDEALASPGGPPAFVVSDDFAVRRDAARWAAQFLSVADLGVLLTDEGILL